MFRSTAAVFDIRSVLVDMGELLHRLRGIQDEAQTLTTDQQLATGWHWVAELDGLMGTGISIQSWLV